MESNELTTTDPHPNDLGGCGHCDARGPVTDCPHCGEWRCAACAAQPCREPVACSCGEPREGREVVWVDTPDGDYVPTCSACPMVPCERCMAPARKWSMTRRRYDWHRGEVDLLVCEDCRRECAA